MKRNSNLLFTFFLLFSSSLFSQGLQYELGINDTYKQDILQIANKNEFSYALVRYNYFNVFLEKFDTLGNRLQRKPISPASGFISFNVTRMVITNDNNIWLAGSGYLGCDFPGEFQHVLVYDSNCEYLNHFSKDLGFGSQGNANYSGLSPISDTSVAVNYHNYDSSWVEFFSPSTQSNLQNYQTPSLFGFGKNSQFHLLGHTINKIYGIDNQGILQDSITLPDTFREIGTWNDTIIVLGYNQLFKVTPDLLSFTTHPIPNLSNFSKLKIDNQGVRFVSSNFNKGVHYLNHNLDIQSLTTVPVFSSSSLAFDFDNNVTVAADFGLTHFNSIRLANYSLTNSQNASINRSDIAVIGLQFTDYLAQDESFSNYHVYKLNAKANVLIRNVGQNIVDSVRLNHNVGQNIACGYNVTGKYFSNLNLAPGDSTWLDFGWLGAYTDFFNTDSIQRTYCVYSSNPNGIVDLNISNDNFCKTAFFGMLGAEEMSKAKFEIFPNPATDKVNVNFSGTARYKYGISNSIGQNMLEGELDKSSIDLTNLASGIYILTITNDQGQILETQRLVKE